MNAVSGFKYITEKYQMFTIAHKDTKLSAGSSSFAEKRGQERSE